MGIKYFGGNKITGLSGDTKPTLTDDMKGATFFETNTSDLYIWDSDSWEIVAGNTLTEDLSGKTFTDFCKVSEVSTPSGTVGAGRGVIYAKTVSGVGKAFWKFENETEIELTAGAGVGTTLSGHTDTTISGEPSSGTTGHILVYDNNNSWDNKLLAGIAAGGAGECVISITNAGLVGINSITGLANSGTVLDLVSAGNVSIFPTMGTNTLSVGASGSTVNILGNLIVSGVTTTVNTQTLTVEDPLILLSSGASGSGAVDAGFVVERGSDTNMAFVWDETEDAFGAFSTSSDASGAGGNINVTTYQPLQIGGLTATTGAFSSNLTTNRKLLIDTDAFNITLGADGHLFHIDAQTMTDNSTSASGTASANFALFTIDQPTLAATNASTTTNAYTMYIANAPAAGGNETLTNSYALYVAGGASHFVGAITSASSITGATLVSSGLTTLDSLIVTGATSLRGAIGLGNGTEDVITFTGRVADGAILPANDNLVDLGGSNNEFKDLYIDGTAYIDAIATATVIATPTVSGTLNLAEDAIIKFEGATAGGSNQTTLTVVDPTAARVVSLPNATDTLVGKATTDELTNKTLTTPLIVDGGSINCGTHNSGVNQHIIFDSIVDAVNEVTIKNAATSGTPTLAATGGDTDVALTLMSKGADGIIVAGSTDNGAFLEFQQIASPGSPSLEYARLYLKRVDAQNNAIAVKLQKARVWK